jgi:transcriptional regulator with AAA-type ATPase domain
MAEPSASGPEPRDPSPAPPDRRRRGQPRTERSARPPLARTFRWQAFFRQAADPVFVLDRRQRILFVNEAWETLTKLPASEAHLLVCRRPRPVGAGDSLHAVLEHALTPPPEVRQGAVARVRRLLPGRGPGRRWWEVEFFPLRQGGEQGGVLIVGRITPVETEDGAAEAPLPERLAALRARAVQRYGLDMLPEGSPTPRRLAGQVRVAAQTDAPVLLVGEPGAGKRTLARIIHYAGRRRERPMAALDCGRLPAAAVAELIFGGAPGALGAIYLHEPGRLPRDLQLRLCEWQDCDAERSPPRLFAGCVADPVEEVRAGRLLPELYAALSVLMIHVPPLRERMESLPLLLPRLLERTVEGDSRRPMGLSAEALEAARGYSWPGNLRELHAVLSAAQRHAKGERIEVSDLPAYLRLAQRMDETPGKPPARPLPLDELLKKAERRLIELALKRTGGHKTRAAEILSIWRMRLTRRMQALGIEGADETPLLELDEDAET